MKIILWTIFYFLKLVLGKDIPTVSLLKKPDPGFGKYREYPPDTSKILFGSWKLRLAAEAAKAAAAKKRRLNK